MLAIPEVTDIDVVFAVTPHGLPAWDDLPEDFRRERGAAEPWCDIVSTLFFKGGSLKQLGLTPKEGVDVDKAMRAIRCCLTSFEPSHEHKTAGVAFMFSEWFDRNAD